METILLNTVDSMMPKYNREECEPGTPAWCEPLIPALCDPGSIAVNARVAPPKSASLKNTRRPQ